MASEPSNATDAPKETKEVTPQIVSKASQTATAQVVPENLADVPDPDEDDLDELDDVLDEFAATNISKSTPSAPAPVAQPADPSHATAGASKAPTGVGPGGLFANDDEFAKSLQQGMAELLGEFESNPEMQKQFEDLVKELGDGMTAAQESPPALETKDAPPVIAQAGTAVPMEAPADPSKPAASFEETIRATMERMQSSNASASQASAQANANSQEDFLAQMLREMESSGMGTGSDEDFSQMLLGMMEQLTNKEILYEPMKELHDKFPAWMKDNEGKIPDADWQRYKKQQTIVGEIVAKFEEQDYSDDKPAYREYIVERMQSMQMAGAPPPDLVGDMDAANATLGDMESGCPQQ